MISPTQDDDFLEGYETVIVAVVTYPGCGYTVNSTTNTGTITIQDANRAPNVDPQGINIFWSNGMQCPGHSGRSFGRGCSGAFG